MVQLIRILAALAAVLVPAAAYAQDVDYSDPHAVVQAAYEPYLDQNFDWGDYDPSALRSKELNALYDRDAKESEAAGEVGRLDFDPLINGQDYDITSLVIGEAKIKGKTAVVPVTFENMGTPSTIEIDLVKEDYGWSIDDVKSTDGDITYSLRDILEAPYP
jgi:hypothetical protein